METYSELGKILNRIVILEWATIQESLAALREAQRLTNEAATLCARQIAQRREQEKG